MFLKKAVIVISLLLFTGNVVFSQTEKPKINNLVHTPDYKYGEWGAIPEYIKSGKGKKVMILIPGWGFDASVFKDFMDANKKNYTMYAITVPGYGSTKAPAMPTGADTSYGNQYWSKGIIQGVLKLIEKEKLVKPLIAGHFTHSTQLALRMAVDYPDKVGAVIILGGPAKFVAVIQGKVKDSPLSYMISGTDKYVAPMMFKRTSKKDWDEGNYASNIYSLDSVKGKKLWEQSAMVPVPVMVRYLLEFQACDLKAELDKIKCPVLVLRSMFNAELLDATINNYVRPQYIDAWNGATEKNPLIQVKDIKESATFIWKDKSKETYEAILSFIKGLK